MNKIAKILSVVLSASIALTVAVVTLVSALAADTPVFSLTKVSEDDTTYVVSVNLESGKFNNCCFEIKTSDNLTKCTKIEKGTVLKTAMLDMENVVPASNAETAKATIASVEALDGKGSYFVFTFEKKAGAKIGAADFTITENDIGAKVENNVPALVVETTTEKPVETTKAPETTTEAKEVETTTEAEEVETTTEAKEVETTTEAKEVETTTEAEEVETTTEAEEVETTTEAEEVETTTEAAAAEDDTTTAAEADDTTTVVVEDGTTAEAVVVNPNTGDSATASAAIVALLAISGAAVVALRKKED